MGLGAFGAMIAITVDKGLVALLSRENPGLLEKGRIRGQGQTQSLDMRNWVQLANPSQRGIGMPKFRGEQTENSWDRKKENREHATVRRVRGEC